MELTKFEQKYMTAFKELSQMAKDRKALDEQDKKVRAEIEEGMEKYGIASIDNEFVKITRVAPTVSESLDAKAFRLDEPKTYRKYFEKYKKVTERKGYVRISPK